MPAVTATSVTSAPRRLNVPQPEAWTCLNIGGSPEDRIIDPQQFEKMRKLLESKQFKLYEQI